MGDTDCVSTRNTPPYGEQVVSWHTVWDRLYPEDADAPHDDDEAAAMHRLRGLVMAQGAEVEAVLGLIVQHLSAKAIASEATFSTDQWSSPMRSPA